MKKNGSVSIATLVLCIVALFIPTYIAIATYLTGPTAEYEKKQNEIISMTVTDTQGTEFSYSRGGDGQSTKMIGIFSDIFANAQQVQMLTDAVRNTPAYLVKVKTAEGEHSYRFYFATKGSSYFEDDAGTPYGITEASASPFFGSECAVSLFYKTPAPVLKTAFGTPIEPTEMSWLYLTHTGEYSPIKTEVTTEVKTYDLGGDFSLSFDMAPDNTSVTVYANNESVYTGTIDNMSTIGEVKKNTDYKIEVSAEWFKDKERNYCGSAKYIFSIEIATDPAAFSLGENSLEAGQIGVINAKNIKDPSHIKVTFTPALTYKGEEIKPVFYGADGTYSALFPVPESCFSDNDQTGKSMKYEIEVSYGSTSYTLNLNVAARTNVKTVKGDAKKADVTSLRTEAALAQFATMLKDNAQKTSAQKLWDNEKFYTYYSADVKFALAFGRIWELSTGVKYTNEFVQYKMKANKDIVAVNGGKVVATGENDYLGKFIVVDHGLGLQSWYLHLSDISVSSGDTVTYKQVIGKSGTTGFRESSDIGFAMMFTVNGVPVCPYAQSSGKGLEETGLKVEAFKAE